MVIISFTIIVINNQVNKKIFFFPISIGSLYDLWNQNYIVVGSKDNVKYFTRVALGAYANPML
jgi:hypothetical protein